MQFHKNNIGPEWQDLVNEFPEIFLELSPQVLEMFEEYGGKGFPETLEECCNLRYGAECDIGWKNIIREFCFKIRELVNTAKENGHEIYYKTFILKEKFGTLRDQGDFGGKDSKLYRDEYRKISADLENASHTVCELTGKPGRPCRKSSGWLKTVSDGVALEKGMTPISTDK